MAYDPRESQRQEYLLMKQQAMMQKQMIMQQAYSGYPYPKKEETLEKAATTECIVGLRVWKVVDDKGLPKLASVVKNTFLWPYRKALERDPIMAEGIHAVRPGDHVIRLFQEYKADVAGEVYLWGKVIECDLGYLAECAYPKKLLVPSSFDPIKAMQLEDEYGVPCEFREELVSAQAQSSITASGIMQYASQSMQNAAGLGSYGLAGLLQP